MGLSFSSLHNRQFWERGIEAAAGLRVIWRAQQEYKEFKYNSFSFPLLLFSPVSFHMRINQSFVVMDNDPLPFRAHIQKSFGKDQTWTPAISALLEVTFCTVGHWDSWMAGLHCTPSTFNHLSETLADHCLSTIYFHFCFNTFSVFTMRLGNLTGMKFLSD